MGQMVKRWLAEDGSEHETEELMLIHELMTHQLAEIENFLDHYNGDGKALLRGRRTEYKRVLERWEAHRVQNLRRGSQPIPGHVAQEQQSQPKPAALPPTPQDAEEPVHEIDDGDIVV
jgi:hypothetical protein